jgi:transposase
MDGIRRFAGIDWAKATHAVCIIDEQARVTARFEVDHDAAGLRELARRLGDVAGVAIERPDGPVVDALLGADIPVTVIASRHVKALRTRHGLAGNKDDRMDAFILADALRTDGHRLRPLRPDAPATVALRATVRARKDLVQTRVTLVQQLEAHLALVFPGAVDLFDDLASPIAQAFLHRFPCAERASWLSPKRMAAWLAAQGYCGRRTGAELHARLEAAPPGAAGGTADAMAAVTLGYVGAIAAVRDQADALGARIVEMLALHPDGHIFTSLPRSGRGSAWRPCSPRSVTAGSGSRHRTASPASPGRRRRPGSRASIARSAFVGAATRSCATRSSTSRRTAVAPLPGRPTSTRGHEPAARAILMRRASSLEPGSR